VAAVLVEPVVPAVVAGVVAFVNFVTVVPNVVAALVVVIMVDAAIQGGAEDHGCDMSGIVMLLFGGLGRLHGNGGEAGGQDEGGKNLRNYSSL